MAVIFNPHPPEDSADVCMAAGWRYVDDIEKLKKVIEKFKGSPEVLLGEIARRGAEQGDPTVVFLPDGMFFSAAQTVEDGRWMVLPLSTVTNNTLGRISISRA